MTRIRTVAQLTQAQKDLLMGIQNATTPTLSRQEVNRDAKSRAASEILLQAGYITRDIDGYTLTLSGEELIAELEIDSGEVQGDAEITPTNDGEAEPASEDEMDNPFESYSLISDINNRANLFE